MGDEGAGVGASRNRHQNRRVNFQKPLALEESPDSLDDPAAYEQAALQTVESQPQVDAIVEAEQNREKLEKAMSQLSSDERLLLRLRYLQGLTLQEVARLMQLNDLHQVRRRLERAVAKLSDFMSN